MAGGALLNASTTALQLEKVRSKVPLLYEIENVLFARLEKKGEVVSNRAARVPVQLRPGGAGGLVNLDGGDMGVGTATFYDVATVSCAFFKFGVELTELAKLGTNSSEKAVLNAAKAEVKNGMKQFRAYLDKLTNQLSTGQVGIVGSITGDVITLSTSGNGSNFSARQRFQVGQYLHVVDSGITTVRNSGSAIGPISLIDDANGKITLDGSGAASVIATDLLFAQNSTFNLSTNAVSSTAIYGPSYHQSSAQTGTWLSFNRANYPEVWTPNITASSLLTTAQIRAALNKIRLALGSNSIGKLVAYENPKQTHAYEDLGIIISEIHKGASEEGMDLFFDEGKMRMAGVPILESINADPTRIDFLDLDKWFRVVTKEIDFHEVGGTTVFPKYGASGGLAASELFYFTTGFQIIDESPMSGAYISSLTVPSIYS